MSGRLLFSLTFRRYCTLQKRSSFHICNNFNRNTQNLNEICVKNNLNLFNNTSTSINNKFCRTKYTKSSNEKNTDDSDDENETDDEFKDEKDSKIIRAKLNSLRADLVLKAGLAVARNKIEALFYESKIRVNGKKILKKSVQLNIDDEIDIIKGYCIINSSNLTVSRVKVLSAKEEKGNISVILRRYKNLLIENYEGSNAYKSSET